MALIVHLYMYTLWHSQRQAAALLKVNVRSRSFIRSFTIATLLHKGGEWEMNRSSLTNKVQVSHFPRVISAISTNLTNKVITGFSNHNSSHDNIRRII